MGDRHAIPRLTAALAVLLLALTACGGDDQAAGGADVQDAPTVATVPSEPVAPATPTPDPTEAPTSEPAADPPAPDTPPEQVEEFDEAYVEGVMAELDSLLGDVARHVVSSDRQLDEEFQARMRALYTPNTVQDQIEAWEQGAPLLKDEPEDPTTDVLVVVSGSPECIFFSAERFYDPMLTEPLGAVQPYWLRLVPHEPNPLNPTSWAIDMDTFYRDGSTPSDRCAQG
ncbi:MAG TPA: hypothetical protein VIK95_15555 [Egibacteraceae bacterium]